MHALNPMHQFEIKNVILVSTFGASFYLSNIALVFLCAIISTASIGLLFRYHTSIIPSRIQFFIEKIVSLIYGFAEVNLDLHAKRFLKPIFSLFLFIITVNFFGLLPYGFAPTSHLSVTFPLAFLVFLASVIVLICRKRAKFFHSFIPKGSPLAMAPLLFLLEFFSFFIRPFSLSIRLASNMIAGHVLIEILAFFTIMLGIFGIFPFLFLSIITIMELGVCLLQAYIFSMFACVYINEAYHH